MDAVLSAVSLRPVRFTFLWYRNTNRDEASGVLFGVKTADTSCCCWLSATQVFLWSPGGCGNRTVAHQGQLGRTAAADR